MHRFITGARGGQEVDHDDSNGLNNTSENLIVGSKTDNTSTSRMKSSNTSGYIGVTWCKRAQVWKAQIGVGRKVRFLGHFDCKHEAARVYNLAKRMYHGHRATINVIKKDTP